jgi:purine nucleosidase
MERVIIDTDTAGDDTVALMLALRSPKIKIEAVTINCGNVEFEQQVENALYTIQEMGQSGEVPVYPGCPLPLLREWESADYVHGPDGMGGSFFPKAEQRPEDKHAVDAIIELIHQNPGEIILVGIAPLTNIAVALRKDPTIAKKVKHTYLMAGSNQFLGNVTPAAEYNVWVDPEAAKIVYHSGMPITMVGWEICLRYSVLDQASWDRIEEMGTPEAIYFAKVNSHVKAFCIEHQKLDGSTHPDAVTMAMVIDPSIILDSKMKYVDIEVDSELTRGMTVVDELGVLEKEPNINIVYKADADKYREMHFRLLSGGEP